MILILLLLNSIAFSVPRRVHVCNGTEIIDPPFHGVFESWHPEDIRKDHISLIRAHQKCAFKIECQKGWTARVILNVNSAATHPSVKILDQFGIVDYVFNASNEHFYFNEKGGLIELNTGHHKTHFGFKVDWVENKKIPNPPAMEYVMAFFQNREVEYSHKYYINETYNYPIMSNIYSSDYLVVKAETRVSMNIIASSNEMDRQLLRSIYVYDGPNLESACIGTAYKLWKMKSQYVSTGKYMTIQFASRDIVSDHPMLFVQDYANTDHITQFQGVTCKSGHNCGVYELDATNGPVALLSIYDTNYEEKDVITGSEGKGFLTPHIGGAKKNLYNILTFLNGTDDEIFLPQVFIGPLKTYVLHNGTMKINITRKPEEFQKTRTLERNGFIVSNWYGRLDNRKQYVYDEVLAPEGVSNAKFEYRIKYLWIDESSEFKILGFRNGTKTYEKIFKTSISFLERDRDSGYPKVFEDEFYGGKMTVDFNATSYQSGGVKVSFSISKP